MATRFDLDALFEDFFYTSNEVLQSMESELGLMGIWVQYFKLNHDDKYRIFSDANITKKAMQNLRDSYAWAQLETLFEYGTEGIISNSEDPNDVITAGKQVISFFTTENAFLSHTWKTIDSLASARRSLDEGQLLTMEDIALLADVDVRTVKNAVSKNEMGSSKRNSEVMIDNLSARIWLSKKKGFKPTINTIVSGAGLQSISTPVQFASLLKSQRENLAKDLSQVDQEPSILPEFVHDLELGIFNQPINLVFQIADFYHFERDEFLDCVMRIFYPEEYSTLISKNRA